MKVFFLRYREAALVFFISLFATVVTTAGFFAQALRAPPDHVFVGVTHYYEDFFYYLDQFYQGKEGRWLTENRFTIEKLPPSLIYFNNLLLGKVGGLFGWEPFTAYNVSLLALKFIFLLVSYFVLKLIFPDNFRFRLCAFLIFVFSTSLPLIDFDNQGLKIVGAPVGIFRMESRISSRFGNIPAAYIINILFLLSLIFGLRLINFLRGADFKLRPFIFWVLLLFLTSAWLSVSEALKGSFLAVIILLAVYFGRPERHSEKYSLLGGLTFLVVSLPVVMSAWYTAKTVNLNPAYSYANRWDLGEYYQELGRVHILDYLRAFGFLGIFFILGLPSFLKKKKKLFEVVSVLIAGLSILGYFLPGVLGLSVPGFRLIFSSTYIFIAVISLEGILFLEKITKRKLLISLTTLFVGVNLITFRTSFMEKIKPFSEPLYHFTYIPQKLFDGLLFLRNEPYKEAVVLASPISSMDLLIPGLTGKKTYSGHFLTTLNAPEKDAKAIRFFFEREKMESPLTFLKENKIRYVIFTRYDGYEGAKKFHVEELLTAYPFLKKVFENDDVTVFSY